MLGVSPGQLTDAQLAQACSTDEGKAGDLVDLAGCATIREMSCLVGLEQMQELNISGCTGIDATTVATVVAKNRTLSALIFGDRMGEPATLEVGMTEAGFSNKNLGIRGAIIISAWITHKDKGALSLLNVALNSLYAGGTKLLAEALKGNQIMTELNISNNHMTFDGRTFRERSGVITLADVIPDMRAMTSLNLASNSLCAEGAQIIAEAIKVTKCTVYTCDHFGTIFMSI
jgi:hypothetical protein